jgi:menaquinone-dependent protoporphyrinogen oxidase
MILVVYASKHGATEGIARFIVERLIERGKQADARPAGANGELGHPEAVVLGSAIYAGSWLKEASSPTRLGHSNTRSSSGRSTAVRSGSPNG